MNYSILSISAVLLTEITLFYNFFLFFSSLFVKSLMWIDLIPWFSGGIIIYILNRWFLKKPRKALAIGVINTVLVAFWLFMGFKLFFHVQGFNAYAYAVFLIILTAGRVLYFVFNGVSETQVLMHTELSIVIAALFFISQARTSHLLMGFNLPSILMVIVNIVTMVRLRIFNADFSTGSVSKLYGLFFILTAILLIAFAIIGILFFLSEPFKLFFINVVLFVKVILSWILLKLDTLLNWFSPKLKFGHEMPEVSNFQVPLNPEKRVGDFYELGILTYIPWIIILLIAAAIIYIIVKYRKRMTSKVLQSDSTNQNKLKLQINFSKRFITYVKVLLDRMEFAFLQLYYRNTTGGVFLAIERIGRKSGFPRKVYESPGAYLKRLMKFETWQQQSDPEHSNVLLNKLISDLEYNLYFRSKATEKYYNNTTLKKKELRELLHSVICILSITQS